MSSNDIAVAVYDTHVLAEDAVRRLARARFDMKAISIIGKDYHTEEQPVGYFNAGDRARYFGKLGAFWGGLAGILFGSALMFVPVVGHIVVLGPIAATIAGGLQGAVLGGGLTALVGALTALACRGPGAALRDCTEGRQVHCHRPRRCRHRRRAREVLTAAGSTDVQAHTAA